MSPEEKIQTRKMLIQPGVDPNVGVDGRKSIVEVLRKPSDQEKASTFYYAWRKAVNTALENSSWEMMLC